jgi:hypothetical protein
MNFGEALIEMFCGKRVRRKGWNGPDQWICWVKPSIVNTDYPHMRIHKFIPEGTDVTVGGYFVIWTQQKIWQPGWLASQNDMSADDWETVKE